MGAGALQYGRGRGLATFPSGPAIPRSEPLARDVRVVRVLAAHGWVRAMDLGVGFGSAIPYDGDLDIGNNYSRLSFNDSGQPDTIAFGPQVYIFPAPGVTLWADRDIALEWSTDPSVRLPTAKPQSISKTRFLFGSQGGIDEQLSTGVLDVSMFTSLLVTFQHVGPGAPAAALSQVIQEVGFTRTVLAFNIAAPGLFGWGPGCAAPMNLPLPRRLSILATPAVIPTGADTCELYVYGVL